RAGDPRFGPGPERHRQVAPGFAAGLTLAGACVGAPDLFARLGVIGTDVAAQTVEAPTSRESLEHLVADHDRAARVDATAVRRGGRVPKNIAGTGAERDPG